MSYAFTLGEETIPYMVRVRAKATRLTPRVTPGLVEIVVPKNTPDAEIQQFVRGKRRWIFEKVEKLSRKEDAPPAQTSEYFQEGAKILYRGRMMPLRVERNGAARVTVTYQHGFSIAVPDTLTRKVDAAIRRELRAWMKWRLAQDCQEFVGRYRRKLGLAPKRISVKTRHRFWGYCSKDGVLGINWQTIFAPKQMVEYIVAHELCHLKYREHSDEFWALLGSVFPGWQTCHAWLDAHESLWDTQM